MDNLIKISTFAREKKVSVVTVYRWINEGKLKMVVIDGVKFIEVK